MILRQYHTSTTICTTWVRHCSCSGTALGRHWCKTPALYCDVLNCPASYHSDRTAQGTTHVPHTYCSKTTLPLHLCHTGATLVPHWWLFGSTLLLALQWYWPGNTITTLCYSPTQCVAFNYTVLHHTTICYALRCSISWELQALHKYDTGANQALHCGTPRVIHVVPRASSW